MSAVFRTLGLALIILAAAHPGATTEFTDFDEVETLISRHKRALHCAPGTYKGGKGLSQCIPCPSGTFREQGMDMTVCKPCKGTITFSKRGAVTCSNCPAGKRANKEKNQCVNCNAGTYRTLYMKVCERCRMNTISPRPGRGIACESCPAGMVPNKRKTRCENCPAGTYRSNNMKRCVKCAGRKYSSEGAAVCTPCPDGTLQNREKTRCDKCPAGTSRRNNMDSCKQCGWRKYSAEEGAAVCESCPDGFESNVDKTGCVDPEEDECSPRSLGCWTDSANRAIAGGIRLNSNNPIEDCHNFAKQQGFSVFAVQYNTECFTAADADETFRQYGESKACQNKRGGVWAQNVYQVTCEVQKESGVPNFEPINFEPINFQPFNIEPVQRQDVIVEIRCKGNRVSDGRNPCEPCPAGTVANIGNTECENCPVGTYRSNSMMLCVKCMGKLKYSSEGAAVCEDCPDGQVPNSEKSGCENCQAGQYRSGLLRACHICQTNIHFSPGPGAADCQQCPDGYMANKLRTECFKCPAGSYRNGNMIRCSACRGDNKMISSEAGSASCTQCPAGQRANEGKTACINA